MQTEGLTLTYSEDGIERLASVAWDINERTENIGARRLHTIMERLLEQISFEAADQAGKHVNVNADYVNNQLTDLAQDEDLSRYIL
jgi:ATP-dependent HslUV protease ATP-binding subunit HslU